MIRLVLARLLPYRSFSKFTLMHLAAIFLVAAAASRFTLSIGNSIERLQSLFYYPESWRTVCGLSRWAFFIPGFFAVQLVTAELELKIVRAQVISGLERTQVVLGWVVQNALHTGLAVLATLLAGAVLGVGPANAPSTLDSLLFVLRDELGFMLYGMAFLNAALLCAVLMRKPVPAVMLLSVWPMLVEPVLAFTLDHYGWGMVNPYLPFNALSSLVTWQTPTTVFNPLAPTTFAAIGYGAVAAWLTVVKLQHTDL